MFSAMVRILGLLVWWIQDMSRYHHYFIESWLSLFSVITTVVSDLCCCCQCEHCLHCSCYWLPSWKCMCGALWVVLWFTCCLSLLLSFLQSILVIHSTWKPPLQPPELKDHQHFRCYKTWWFTGTLHGNSPSQPVGQQFRLVGRRLLKSLAQLRDANREMQEVGRWMSVATHLGHPGTMGFGGSRPGWCELIGALSGSLKN